MINLHSNSEPRENQIEGQITHGGVSKKGNRKEVKIIFGLWEIDFFFFWIGWSSPYQTA